MKRVFNALAITVWAFLIGSCAPEPVRVSQITLNPKALTLNVGDSEKLAATVSPYNADNPTIIWISDNASIASVAGGTVTAVSPGVARITAKADDGGISDVCEVTVRMPVTGVTLDKSTISMYEGEADQLSATVTPDNANNPSLIWISDNPDVVSVTSDGKLFALTPGEANVTVKTVDGNFSATCKVTVQEVSMELKPPTLFILVGDEADIQVMLKHQLEGAQINIHWFSTDESIVTVDDKGHVKAHTAGDAIVCASTKSGKEAFCNVHVLSRLASVSIKAPAGEKEVNIGETLRLTVEVTPADLPGMVIEWKSSDTSVASVTDGLVTAKAKGTVTITVSVTNGPETKTATYELDVLKPVTKFSVTPATLEMFVDDEIEIDKAFSIIVEPDDADCSGFNYNIPSSSTPGVISVSQGKITGVKAGTATLIITPNKANPKKLKAEVKITVKARVEGITIQGGETRTIQVKETVQLKASVTPSNANREVIWSSSSPEIATVDEKSGLVTGVKAGTTVITATSKENSSIKGSCTVTVNSIPVSSVELDKTSLSLVIGDTYALEATVKPDDVFDKSVQWSSSNPSVASVSSAGVVTAIGEGTATITATCGGKSATCTVTVDPPFISVTSVALNQTAATIELGESLQLIATILPERASNKDVTWSSSNTVVARVDALGKVTTSAIGTAVITVTTVDGAKTAACEVTVTAPSVPVSSIVLPYSSYTLTYGKTLDLSAAKVLPEDATDKTLIWTSSDENIASVSDGIVTAKSKAGTATITAASKSNPSVKETCKITVKAQIILVSKVTISPSSLKMYLNETTEIQATVSPTNADNKNVIWSTPQGAVTTVESIGNNKAVVKAVSVGISRIIADSEDGNAQGWIQVTVSKNAVSSVTLSKNELILKVGETYDLKAEVKAEDSAAPASNSNVTWKSSSTSKVSVSSFGRVTAKEAGEATITVTSSDNSSKKDTCKVIVLGSNPGSGGAEGVDFEDWNF